MTIEEGTLFLCTCKSKDLFFFREATLTASEGELDVEPPSPLTAVPIQVPPPKPSGPSIHAEPIPGMSHGAQTKSGRLVKGPKLSSSFLDPFKYALLKCF